MDEQRADGVADGDATQQTRQRLEAERARVAALVERLRDDIGDEPENEQLSELAAYDQHPADQGSETFEREKDLAILEGLENELAELEAALARLDDGTYGVDEETGEPIDPARLEARPEARRNVDRAPGA